MSLSDQIVINMRKKWVWIEFEAAFDVYSLIVCVLRKWDKSKIIERKDVIGFDFDRFDEGVKQDILEYACTVKPIISSSEMIDQFPKHNCEVLYYSHMH